MMQIEYPAVIVSTLVAIIFSAIYYLLLDKYIVSVRAEKLPKKIDTRTKTTPTKLIVEFIRIFIVTYVVAHGLMFLNITDLTQAIFLALWLWVGFPVVFLIGLVLNEKFSLRLAVIHAGDWLAKLLLIVIILTLWG